MSENITKQNPAGTVATDGDSVRVSLRAWSKCPAYDNKSDGFDTIVSVAILEREIFSCVEIKGPRERAMFWVVTEELKKAVAELKL